MAATPKTSKARKLAKTPPETKSTKPTEGKLGNYPAEASTEAIASEKLSVDFEKKIGITTESLRKLFESATPSPEVKALMDMLRARCLDARTFSLRDWRVHAAVDEAYMAPFHQITPTLIGKITAGDTRLTPAEIEKQLIAWGLPDSAMFHTVKNPDGSIRERILLKETFSNVKVPIVKSVLNARESRLFQERNKDPFMSFEPRRSSDEWTVMGEIITRLMEQMGSSYGWKATYRAANHHALKYSNAFMFPVEEWHSEIDYDSDGNEFTKKEGLRYNIPHPTRTACDQGFRPSSFNSDTGCEWASYWRLSKFGDVDRNPAYYNKDKVSYSADNWVGGDYKAYFQTVYPCVMEFPWLGDMTRMSSKDRERNAQFYTSSDNDKAVFLTDMFCKLSPKQWGLSDYGPKVWFRFVMASDGVVTYAAPCPYCPVLYLGIDADDAVSSSVPSFALDALPWQDLVGNVLSQILLAMRQNAIKVVLYDKLQMTEEKIQEMMARAKESYSVNWFGMDWRDMIRGGVNLDTLFKSFTFPQQNVGEMISTLNTLFNVMERALGLSAQDIGAVAGHIQTAKEVDVLSDNSDTRIELISSMADDFFDAWKRQALLASMAYMDEEFVVDVSSVDKATADKMKSEYGFKFDDVGGAVRVTGNKSKLSMDAFISSREGRHRKNQPGVAQVMFQAISGIAGSGLADKIGPEKIIEMWNRALHLAGIPEDAKWQISPEASSVMEQKQLLEMIQKFAKEITAQATQQATQQAAEAATQQAVQAVGGQIEQVVATVGEGVQQVAEQGKQVDMEQQAQIQQLEQHTAQLAQLVMRIDQFLKAAVAQQQQVPQQAPSPQVVAV